MIKVATIRNAAELKSPGIIKSFGLRKLGELIVIFFPFLFTSAPKNLSIISVWSLLGNSSRMVVVPFIFVLASKIALFICADPIFKLYSIGIGTLFLLTIFKGRQPFLL